MYGVRPAVNRWADQSAKGHSCRGNVPKAPALILALSLWESRKIMASSPISVIGQLVPSGTALILPRNLCLHHGGDGRGTLVTPLQSPHDLPPALGGVILIQLPLAFDLLDLDAEADDQRPIQLYLVSRAVSRPVI